MGVVDEAVDELVEDWLSFTDHEGVEAVGQRQRVGDHGCAAGDHDRRALVAVDAERRDAGGLQGPDHVVVVDLVGERVGDDGEVGQRALGFDRDRSERAVVAALVGGRRVVERAFADHIGACVEQRVDRLQAEIRHAEVVGVGVDEREREATAPVFGHGAGFGGQPTARGGDRLGERVFGHVCSV